MTQNIQPTNITKEQNNFVEIGTCRRGIWHSPEEEYSGYGFTTTGYIDEKSVAEKFFKVGIEFAQNLSESRVICYRASWERENSTVGNLLRSVEPVYNETGLMQQFKNNLIAENRKDIIWADYTYYKEISEKSFFWGKPKVHKDFYREVYILQNNMDIDLAEQIEKCSMEGHGTLGIDIFPDDTIIRCETDEDTVKHYIHRKDYIIKMGICKKRADIYMQINPKYIAYDNIIRIINPIFEKYGLKLISTENPYIKAFHCEAICHKCNSYCCFNLDKTKYIHDRINVDDRLNPKTYEKWCNGNKI